METGHQGDVRQYGGYGGYGGFVECCEGVVDPILLLGIIAGAALRYLLLSKEGKTSLFASCLNQPAHSSNFSFGGANILPAAASCDVHCWKKKLENI